MLPPQTRDPAAKSRAAAAAAVAVVSVTPGQRDRAIQQAVLAAQQQHEAAAAADSAGGRVPAADAAGDVGGAAATASEVQPEQQQSAPGTYNPPEWSGIPEGIEYGIETLKNGTLLSSKDLTTEPFYTFGRSPTAHMLLEHPSASRLHAVLQFNGSTGKAFLYDCGSTHGTFLNRNRLKARVLAPIRVGDTIRFGQSSRMYVLTGPADLMPAEGLNKQQKKQLAVLEAAQARKEADEAKARAQMEAALSGAAADGVNWGMAPDAECDEEQQGAGKAVNWRSYVDKNGSKLTDRQTKLLDKIRKREYKVKNLETETAKIAAKERQEGGLTQGQAATMVRNERALEALREELEELEEQLTESITDSIKGKQDASKAAEHKAAAKKRKRADSDDEYAAASDDDDEFYDRTATAMAGGGAGTTAAGKKGTKKAADKKGQAEVQVESAETLWAKRNALLEVKEKLEADIQAEQELLQQRSKGTLEPAAAAAVGAGGGEGAGHQGAVAEEDGPDSLDAFMTNVAENLEQDKLTSLRKELDSISQQLSRTERLIHIADPDGWYKPGTAKGGASSSSSSSAATAAAAAKAALEADRQRRAAAVAAQRAGWAAAQAQQELAPEVEEEEEENEEGKGKAEAADNPADTPAKPTQKPAAARQQPVVIRPKGMIAAAHPHKPAAAQAAPGGSSTSSDSTAGAAAAEAAEKLMKEFAQPAPKKVVKGPCMPPPGFKSRATADSNPKQKQQQGSSNINADAAARVAASIAILSSHRAPLSADDDDMQEAGGAAGGQQQQQAEWLPPSNQKGDGRTSLNEKLGY